MEYGMARLIKLASGEKSDYCKCNGSVSATDKRDLRRWSWRSTLLPVLLGALMLSAAGGGGQAATLRALHLPVVARPYPTLQPKMPPPARHLFVARMAGLSRPERVLMTSLQGLVNRTKPRIFLIWGKDDAFWLKQMQKQGATGTGIPVRHPLSLVNRFRALIRGAVVPDPKVYDSPDIAADIAAVDNLVLATPRLARRLHLPIRVDMRGKFQSDAAALRYLRVRLAKQMNPFLFLCLAPPLLADGGEDQVIAAKGMTFWVTGRNAGYEPGADMAAEKMQVQRLFAATPLDGVVRGYWWAGNGMGLDEDPGVALGSEFGKITVVSDYLQNMSVFSGVKLHDIKQHFAPAPPLNRSKVYLTLAISDGDNLCMWYHYFRHWFVNPAHGKIPIGWGMGPTLIDEAPTLARWYYQHAGKNDEFFCDVSGAGYIYPPDWAKRLAHRRAALRTFYHWTWQYMKRMDMKTLRIMPEAGTSGAQDRASIAEVASALPHAQYLLPDYSYQGEKRYSHLTYTLPSGQAVFRAAVVGGGVKNLARQIRQRVGNIRPAFINVFISPWDRNNLPELVRLMKKLGPGFVDVTPSQLDTLYREASAGGGQGTVK